MDELDLAALLVSRVCHDLISPIGAFSTGLEILAEEEDAEMRAEALQLLGKSAMQAKAKLMFARLAFGAAGSAGAEIELTEARNVLADLFAAGKVALKWESAVPALPKSQVKLLLNLAAIAHDCVPRGGTLTVAIDRKDGTVLSYSAAGPQPRIPRDVALALKGETPEDGIDGRLSQAWLAGLLIRMLKGELTSETSPEGVTLVARLP